MTSRINVKNKQGLTKLASLIKQAGFDDVKVTVRAQSITLTPSTMVDLSAGFVDLKSGRYVSFKSASEAVKFLKDRSQGEEKSVSRKK